MGGYTALHEPLSDLWRLTLPERAMGSAAGAGLGATSGPLATSPLAALAAAPLAWVPPPFTSP